MEVKVLSRLISSYIQRNIYKHTLRVLISARFCSSNENSKYLNNDDDNETNPTYYNMKAGKGGNFNKYYSKENAFTFDDHGRHRFNKERPGEYYAFESFLDPKVKSKYGSSLSISLEPIVWEDIKLAPINKCLYVEPEIVKNRSAYEVDCFRESNHLILKGPVIPNPILHFSDYTFLAPLQKALDNTGFEFPMSIQSQTWPIALSGLDLIGIGRTGSGKTLGFLLPTIIHAINQKIEKGAGPTALILAPTRELVQQISVVLLEMTKYMDFNVCCLFGGVKKQHQIDQMLTTPLVCVSTPGRLMDLLSIKVTTLKNCTFLVLDEADMMLDLGFELQIREIISQIRPDRQTLMWSATWPAEIKDMANEYINNPVQLNVGSTELTANPNIHQEIVITDEVGKISLLRDIIKEERKNGLSKILIFVETKKMASLLNMRLQRKSIPCSDLHGNHDQITRNRVVNAFRKGIIDIVIATDVASRGLDVNDITLVINFAMPRNIETYVHRIGRTGRAGKSGRSISFFSTLDKKLAKPLVRILREGNHDVPKDLYNYCRS